MHYPINGMLAECLPCNFCFCSNCLQDFHGFSDCETKPETTIQEKGQSCTDQLKEYAFPKVRNSKLPSGFNGDEDGARGNSETYPEKHSSYRNDSVPRKENKPISHSNYTGPEVHYPKLNGKMKPITRSKVKQAGADAEQYELGEKINMPLIPLNILNKIHICIQTFTQT